MNKLRLWTLLLFCVLISITASVNAQPAAVQTALDDLNRQTGQNYMLGSTIAYKFREEVFNGNNLGCSNAANTAAGTYNAYIIEFDTNFDGSYEWDYRVSVDGSIFILCQRPAAPVATTDPAQIPTTQPGPTPSSCTSMLPRLSIGGQGRVLPTDPNLMRQQPGTSAVYAGEIPVGGVFTVVDGPRCSDQFTWWQVNYNGVVGWTVESNGSEYWVEVFDANAPAATPIATEEPTPVICDPALPPRLQRLETARVTPGDPNNVRSDPSRNAQKVGEIPGGEEFRVLDGPRCADGLTWWSVQSTTDTSVVGWTVEGASGDYFVEPPLPRTAITSENVGSLTLVKTWEAPNTLIKVIPVSRTTLYVLDDKGYRQEEQINPFSGTTTAEFQEILPLDGGAFADLASSAGGNVAAPVIAQIAPENVTVFVPFTEGGSTINESGVQLARLNNRGTLLVTLNDQDQFSLYNIADITAPVLVSSVSVSGLSDAIFSRDSKRLIVSHDNQIDVYTVDVAGAEPLSLDFSLENDIYNQKLSVSPDGNWLMTLGTLDAASTLGFGYRLFDLQNQSLRWGGLGEGSTYLSLPIFTPDNKAILMTDSSGRDFNMLRVFDVEYGDIVEGYQLPFAGELAFDPMGYQLAIVEKDGNQVQFWGINEG